MKNIIKKKKEFLLLKFYFILVFFFFYYLDKSFSPDYLAYSARFANSEWYLKNDIAIFFDLLTYIINKSTPLINLQFLIFFTINYLFFSYLIFEFLKLNTKLYKKNFFLIFFFLFIFLFSFEYLIIRLRAGTCILLMFASFIFFLKNKKNLSFIFLLCGVLTHIKISLIFIYASFFLIFLKKCKQNIKYQEALFFVILSFGLVLGVYIFNKFYIYFYDFNYKPLNIYRMFFYCLFPIVWIIYMSKLSNIFLINKANNFTEIYLKMLFYFLVFVLLFSLTYYRKYIGEDILRIFGVLSFISIFLLLDAKYFKKIIILNFYILIINYLLFFKNLIYLLK